MTKEESLKILKSIQERLENMSDEEKEALRKDAEEFLPKKSLKNQKKKMNCEEIFWK